MKSIFNEADEKEILARIEKLTPESKALWGKMNVAQMLAHAAKGAGFPNGDTPAKSSPMSILGQFFKKPIIMSEAPLRKNTPTSPEIKMADEKDFNNEKDAFIKAVKKLYEQGHNGIKVNKHPFFGKMPTEEWGVLNYKHADHHLRQFGV